jgi:hypothetical protein
MSIISAYLGTAGLSDVGYRFYNGNETANGVRIAAGVVDAGDGWYSADATFPSGIASVRWNSAGQPLIIAREYFSPITADNINTIAATVWQVLTSGFTTAGSVGKLILDNLNATVSSRSTYAGTDTPGTTTLLTRVPSALTITSGKVDVNDKTGFSLTSAYDPAKTAAQPGSAMTLTAGERDAIAAAEWNWAGTPTAGMIGDYIKKSLPGLTPGASGGLFIAGSNVPTSVNFTGDITGNLNGNVTGSVHNVEDTDSIAIAVRDISNASPAAGSLGADVKAGIGGSGGGASWDEMLPGSHAPGTAGYILGHNLDAQVSTRLPTSGYTTPPDAATIGVACRDTNNASPAAGSVGDKINSAAAGGDPWSVAIPAAYPAGSAGKILGDRLDVLVSSRLATTGYTVAPSAAVIADSVRDVSNATPASGSLGEAVNAAASAGDPWQTPLPGPYPPGSAGKLISDQLDAKVSTRLATSSYTAPRLLTPLRLRIAIFQMPRPLRGRLETRSIGGIGG